jgi:hypothetical protein
VKNFVVGFSVLCCAGAALTWSEPAPAAQVVAGCTVVDVATFNNRVHIHCTPQVAACDLVAKAGACEQQGPASTAPTYVAVEATSPMASSVVQVGLSALVNKRSVNVYFDDNAGVNPPGCNANDCRRLIGVAIH